MFWVVHPGRLYSPVSISTSHVDIEPFGNIEDIQTFIEAVAFVESDGTITLAEVSSVVDQTTTWRINFVAAIVAPTLSNVRKFTSAHHVRMASDSIRETWITDETVTVTMEMIDALAEQELVVTVTDEDLDESDEIDDIPDLYYWGAVSKNVRAGSDAGPFEYPVPQSLTEGSVGVDFSWEVQFIQDVRNSELDGDIELRAYGDRLSGFQRFEDGRINKSRPTIFTKLSDGSPGFFLNRS